MPKTINATPFEEVEQADLIWWCHHHPDPRVSLITPSLSGVRLPIALAAKMKRQGLLKGDPDLHLPVPIAPYHGLYIEMKRLKGGQLSQEQKVRICQLEAQGYRVDVCKGAEAAKVVINDYLEGSQGAQPKEVPWFYLWWWATEVPVGKHYRSRTQDVGLVRDYLQTAPDPGLREKRFVVRYTDVEELEYTDFDEFMEETWIATIPQK
jgi:VRR-NUC domain